MKKGTPKGSLQDWLLDPDKGLFQHKFFWIMAFLPVAVGFSLGLPVWAQYALSFSADGYNKFLEISKLPLGIMALGIPFGAVVAGFHRAVQTTKQIRITEENNLFRNYIDHKKEFVQDVLDSIYDGDKKNKKYAVEAYDNLFPRAIHGELYIRGNALINYSGTVFREIKLHRQDFLRYFSETVDLKLNQDSISKAVDIACKRLVFQRARILQEPTDNVFSFLFLLSRNGKSDDKDLFCYVDRFNYHNNVCDIGVNHSLIHSEFLDKRKYSMTSLSFKTIAVRPDIPGRGVCFYIKDTPNDAEKEYWLEVVDFYRCKYDEIYDELAMNFPGMGDPKLRFIIDSLLIVCDSE